MPKCIVIHCPHSCSKKVTKNTGVVMHTFPFNLDRIKNWLLSIDQNFGNIDTLANRILEEKKKHSDLYRLCSEHFTPQCYISTGKRMSLRPDAIPTIFKDRPPNKEKKPSINPQNPITNVKPNLNSNQDKYVDVGTNTETVVMKDISTRTDIYHCVKHRGTRTDPFWGKKNVKTKTDPLFGMKNASTSMEPAAGERGTDTHRLECDNSFSKPGKRKRMDTENLDAVPCHSMISEGAPSRRKSRSNKNPHCILLRSKELESVTSDSSANSDNDSAGNVDELMADQADVLVHESKYIVFESCLDELLLKMNCSCGRAIAELIKSVQGTFLSVSGRCEVGHVGHLWDSQPKNGGTPAGNILCSAAVFFSGSRFQQVDELFRFMGLQFIAQYAYYQYEKRFLFPVLNSHWQNERRVVAASLPSRSVCLSGDGQFSRPGNKYCTYTLLETASKKIIDFSVVKRTEKWSLDAIKKRAFETCLNNVLAEKLTVETVATERHDGIRWLMSEEFSPVYHEYDVWHYGRAIRRKLLAASKKRSCRDIATWTPAIIKHLWHVCKCSAGDCDLLQEKWRSILRHIRNEHQWTNGLVLHNCGHRRLSSAEAKQRRWLKVDSRAYQQLKKIITDPLVLGDLTHLSSVSHTDQVEVFHSFMLKYQPKRAHVSQDAMEASTQLAALAHNANVHRHQSMSRNLGANRELSSTLPKARKPWTARRIYDPKSSAHLFPMLVDILKLANGELGHSWRLHETQQNS
ncbi:uncharacterized protein LOC108715301 [Xenopus laevis]|uniref:Uncharacterized protein LOC108715301 n=2 Tax=Xenopus laevis TaxID=8355 RepID=A0A1L8GE67_XENLA|nr:uncharacterized protein LOC108715301 [Xenopus laevis]OCT82101.1 hypothetical protein XELAEV_18024609mg [Xenopus laevis]